MSLFLEKLAFKKGQKPQKTNVKCTYCWTDLSQTLEFKKSKLFLLFILYIIY